MRTEYDNAAEASDDILRSLQRDFPDALIEVTYHTRGRPRAQHHVAPTPDLGQTLRRYIERFSGAHVYYTPHHPYGLICIVECWCGASADPNSEEACACTRLHNHSAIVLMVKERSHVPVLLGEHRTPPQARPKGEPLHPWRAEEMHARSGPH